MKKWRGRNARIIMGVIMLALLISAAWGGYVVRGQAVSQISPLTLDTDGQYPYVRPLLGVSIPESYGASALSSLRASVAKAAASEPAQTYTRYSFYYRNLSTGVWTGINEQDQYDPGSMLKLVVALAAYKQEEATPGFLERPLTYTQDLANINAEFPFATGIALRVGQSYPVRTLLKDMLSDSDNASKDLLLSSIDQTVIDKVYTDLSVQKPNDDDSAGYTISPRDYSRFLRVLYYGTYDLSWQDSNDLLGLLTKATYTDGLVAGVPEGTQVAHKYGEHVNGADNVAQSVELSDCGIVYYKPAPYLICVMTEGKDEASLAGLIAAISKATYSFASSAK